MCVCDIVMGCFLFGSDPVVDGNDAPALSPPPAIEMGTLDTRHGDGRAAPAVKSDDTGTQPSSRFFSFCAVWWWWGLEIFIA